MKKAKFLKKKGQGMTEYIIIVALIAVAAIAIIQTFGQTLRVQLGKITSQMQGEGYKGAKMPTVTTNKTGEKTLKSFANN